MCLSCRPLLNAQHDVSTHCSVAARFAFSHNEALFVLARCNCLWKEVMRQDTDKVRAKPTVAAFSGSFERSPAGYDRISARCTMRCSVMRLVCQCQMGMDVNADIQKMHSLIITDDVETVASTQFKRSSQRLHVQSIRAFVWLFGICSSGRCNTVPTAWDTNMRIYQTNALSFVLSCLV